MAYKVLYRKYRPDDFDNVVGQDYTVEMLKNAIKSDKHSHAYIFTGPRGTGKTSSAKLFAKALNCENPIDGNPCNKCSNCLSFKESPDVIEIDAASNNGVDEIRELINNVKLVPNNSKFKVYIIDEVHMLTTSAFNALLLTLEEPPSHVVFILATTDIQNVPITILSRCQRLNFKPISMNSLIDRLKFVCENESIKASDDALREIALLSAGGMRDALGMLDQLSSDDGTIEADMVSNYFGSISKDKLDKLLTCISNNDIDELLVILNDIKDSGTNYTVFIEKLIDVLKSVCIDIKKGCCKLDLSFDSIYSLILDLNECLSNININIDPFSLIEIVLLKYLNNSSQKYFPGNTNGDFLGNNVVFSPGNNEFDMNADFLGNKIGIKNDDFPGNTDVLKEKKVKNKSENKKNSDISLNNSSYLLDADRINIRINNCFYGASKELKSDFSSKWIEFMNYLMGIDRNLLSLIADTTILAASSDYALINSKIDSTNSLINEKISVIEDYYVKFSGKELRLAAISDDLWKKEVEKYRFNLKNKIKYKYIDEIIDVKVSDEKSDDDVFSDAESVGNEIFGSMLEVK